MNRLIITKYMNRFLTLLISAFLLVSCNKPKETNINFHDTIDYHSVSKSTINELVDSISFLPLEIKEESTVGNIDKICIVDSLIYIGDFHTNQIYIFDLSGKHLFNINYIGQGPKEYTEIKSFAVDTHNIYIIDNRLRKLFVYNRLNGSFVESLKMPFVAWDIETLNDGDFIFTFIPMNGGKLSIKQPPYKLFITDSHLNIKKMMLKYNDNESDALGQRIYFTKGGNNLYFGSYHFNGYTIIDTDTLSALKHININFDKGLAEQDNVHLHEIDEYQYIIEPPFVCEQYVYLVFCEKGRSKYGIYNTVTREISFNSKTDAYNSLMPIIGSGETYFIGHLADYDIYQKMVNLGFNKGSELMEETLKKQGDVLVFYHFK